MPGAATFGGAKFPLTGPLSVHDVLFEEKVWAKSTILAEGLSWPAFRRIPEIEPHFSPKSC